MRVDGPVSATNLSWLVPSVSILKMAFPWLKSKNGAGSGVEKTKQDQLIGYHCIFAALSSR